MQDEEEIDLLLMLVPRLLIVIVKLNGVLFDE